MRSLGNRGHVDTDVWTLRDLLKAIRSGRKAKAAEMVLGILRKQRLHEAEHRRRIAELIRADGQRQAANAVAAAEAAAARHVNAPAAPEWQDVGEALRKGKGKAKRTARRSSR